MKNAGMAGAVALVGIGLITIGLSNFANRAEAVPSAIFQRPGGGGFPSEPAEAGCPLILFEPVLRTVDLPCPTIGRRAQDFLVHADLLGRGHSQPIFLPSAYDNCNFMPMQIFAQDGIYTMTTWLPDLTGGDWGNCSISAEGLIDMDGDGRLDLLLSSFSDSPFDPQGTKVFAWLRNIYDGPARLPADLDHDGDVDGADLGELFSQWTG